MRDYHLHHHHWCKEGSTQAHVSFAHFNINVLGTPRQTENYGIFSQKPSLIFEEMP